MSKRRALLFIICLITCISKVCGQQLAVLKYDGGGDWYANPTALINLSTFYNKNTGAQTTVINEGITLDRLADLGVSFLHATGHGRIIFSDSDCESLRAFVERGGFLHIDDNYGMKEFAETALDACFPAAVKVEVAHTHPIFNSLFAFSNGLPKIHAHDNLAPSALGYFIEGELVALLTSECDLGDGWEDANVHNDPIEIREKALKMGANLVHWSIVRE